MSSASFWPALLSASERLAEAKALEAVVAVLRETARGIAGADGIAIVLREADMCFYAAEDAVSPLWAGQRFPAESCVSGWAMQHRQTVRIGDVREDARVPQAAYAATFVRSMLMVPIGREAPVAALGAYWSRVDAPDDVATLALQGLARVAAIAIENVRLIGSLGESEGRLRESEARFRALAQARGDELDLAHDALRQAHKLEAMGQLTGGVAHDFNNLLTPIISGLDMLQRRALGNAGEQRLIAGALQSAERAKLLVQRLLAFARRQPLQATAVDVEAMLLGMADLVRSTVGPTVQLRFEVAAGIAHAQADVNQLELAVLNLAVNARDAMPEGGTLSVMATEIEAEEAHAPELAPGRYVQLIVADTGIGMSDQTLARAVEPFFSTKGVGKGTGLGLSMVHGLAHQLQGGMRISSKAGFGTAVCLWLPVSSPGIDPAVAEAAAGNPATVLGSALVVDDEELVRQATAAMVAELGYTVVEAGSAAEALGLLDRHGRFDVVVTDHLMPETSGVELAHRVRAMSPSTVVLLVSGFAEESGVDASLPRLNKPFRQAELAASLQAAGVGQCPPPPAHPAQ